MEVGIRELKAHLSAYLAQVADGATIVVTDRGKPVATLSPVAGSSMLAKGVDEGWIEPAKRSTLAAAQPMVGRHSISSTLDDDRG